jgi:beta-1,4-N-acetylglucosaminyltransferase
MKTVVICYGEGGHAVQARRFVDGARLHAQKVLKIGEAGSGSCVADYFLENPFPKRGGILVIPLIKNIFQSLWYVARFRVGLGSKVLVSFGPGITVFLMIFWRVSGGKAVYIETWSRFYSASSTGKLAYIFLRDFYIQNEELKHVYPKAKYAGRL